MMMMMMMSDVAVLRAKMHADRLYIEEEIANMTDDDVRNMEGDDGE